MFADWQIKSRISDIFEPKENPLYLFVDATEKVMNSNTVLLKGETDRPISLSPEYVTEFFSLCISDYFHDLFFDYDRMSQKYDYHIWQDTEEAKEDFFKGYS